MRKKKKKITKQNRRERAVKSRERAEKRSAERQLKSGAAEHMKCERVRQRWLVSVRVIVVVVPTTGTGDTEGEKLSPTETGGVPDARRCCGYVKDGVNRASASKKAANLKCPALLAGYTEPSRDSE